MSVVLKGDRVRIHYTTHSGDDCVLETSALRDPLEFIAGGTDVIAGLSAAVIGMRTGEKKRIRVPPEQAFGFRDPRWQQTSPRLGVPDRVTAGDQLTGHLHGRHFPVWVRGFREDEVTMDANHPLAGETLVINLELVGIGTDAVELAHSPQERTLEKTL